MTPTPPREGNLLDIPVQPENESLLAGNVLHSVSLSVYLPIQKAPRAHPHIRHSGVKAISPVDPLLISYRKPARYNWAYVEPFSDLSPFPPWLLTTSDMLWTLQA